MHAKMINASVQRLPIAVSISGVISPSDAVGVGVAVGEGLIDGDPDKAGVEAMVGLAVVCCAASPLGEGVCATEEEKSADERISADKAR